MPRRNSSVQSPTIRGPQARARADRMSHRPAAMPGPSQRQLRVGELLRHALAEILRRGEVRDPDLDGVSVTVTQVKPSPDMRHATVYLRTPGRRECASA